MTTKKTAKKKSKKPPRIGMPNLTYDEETALTWAAAAAASDVDGLLSHPTDADSRGRLETVAAMVGIVDPEDLADADLEKQVEEVIDDEVQRSLRCLHYLRERVFVPDGSFGGIAMELWDELGEESARGGWEWMKDGALVRVNLYAWRPITDPASPHFDVRIELPLDPKTRESVAKQGIIVPALVTVNADGELVVLDGIQRWRAALDVNRERLARWAQTGNPQPLITEIPVKVVRDRAYAALGAVNEVRQEQDRMTRALRLDALMKHGGLDLDEAAASLGMGRRMATYYLSLLKLSPTLQRKVRSGGLSFALARVVCQLDGAELQHAAVKAVAKLPSALAIASLRASLAEDALAAALAGGAPVAKPESAKPGTITACAVTGAWFLVTETSATVKTGEGPRYVAPGSEGVEPPPPKGLDRVRSALRSGVGGGTPRDRRVAEAMLAAIEGREVEGEFRWILGVEATAGRRRASSTKKPKGKSKIDRLDGAIVALLDEEGHETLAGIGEILDATKAEITAALSRLILAAKVRRTVIEGEEAYVSVSRTPTQTDLEARIAEVSR